MTTPLGPSPDPPKILDAEDPGAPLPPRLPFAARSPEDQAAIAVPWAETVLPAFRKLVQALDELDDANREWRAGLRERVADLPVNDKVPYPKVRKPNTSESSSELPRALSPRDMLAIGDGMQQARAEYFGEEQQVLYTRALGAKLGGGAR